MLRYITKNEYLELLEAESIPNNFNNLVIEASNYINYQTHGRIDLNNVSEQVKYVTCLIVNLIDEENTKLNEIKMDPEVLKELKREGKKIVYFDMDGVLNNK